MVQEYRTTNYRIKGKLCHFGKNEFFKHKLEDYYWKKIEEVNLEELKTKIVNLLKKEGFVFFNEIEYKYVTQFGKLADFAVNFHHIL